MPNNLHNDFIIQYDFIISNLFLTTAALGPPHTTKLNTYIAGSNIYIYIYIYIYNIALIYIYISGNICSGYAKNERADKLKFNL